ncbi:MAG TPA: sigma-70 family RNA polymerase sigma factor [Candidatus Eremiobacteraceae bacterium]
MTMLRMTADRPPFVERFFVRADNAVRVLRPVASRGAGSGAGENAVVQIDDGTIVKRIADGDHGAFAALYDKHSALVYGVAKRVLGNREQAEDVTQSVFLQVWARPEAFAGGNFAAWIARVARNASLDILRSAAVRTREPEISIDLPAEGALEEQVFERVRATALATAVAALPEDQRIAIEQAYFAGLSYREVADRLNAPLGTVKSRIRMGLRKLLESLQQVVPT